MQEVPYLIKVGHCGEFYIVNTTQYLEYNTIYSTWDFFNLMDGPTIKTTLLNILNYFSLQLGIFMTNILIQMTALAQGAILLKPNCPIGPTKISQDVFTKHSIHPKAGIFILEEIGNNSTLQNLHQNKLGLR